MAHGKTFNVLGVELNRNYMFVWVALLVLTLVEVLIPEPTLIGLPELPRAIEVVSLILVALIKTVLVAWFYMHLVDERGSLIAIAAAPFVFSIFLTIGLFPYGFPAFEKEAPAAAGASSAITPGAAATTAVAEVRPAD